MSRFGLICCGLFVVFSVLGRLLYPYTDEPDWQYRVDQILHSSVQISPYFWVRAVVEHDRLAIQANVYPNNLTKLWTEVHIVNPEPLDLKLARLGSSILIALPILAAITFRSQCDRFLRSCGYQLPPNTLNTRLDALSVSLLFPGAIYYMGVLAYEQAALVLSMMLVVVWGLIGPVLLCVAFVALIDLGSAIVVFLFCAVLFVCTKTIAHAGALWLTFAIILSVLLALVARDSIINNLTVFSALAGHESELGQKAEAMQIAFSDGATANRYPFVVRPLITYMSFVLLTPSGVKALPSYFLLGAIVAIVIVQNLSMLLKNQSSPQYMLAPLALILLLVAIFPAYANAKYFLFTLPFISLYALQFYKRRQVLLAYCLVTVCTFTSLLISHL